MEALAMGSKKVDGSACEGIIVTNDLPVESNPYMTSSTNARNMFDRLDLLINKADIIVALPGSIGTLNEIIMATTMNYITDQNQRQKKPVFVSRRPWQPIWQSICKELEVGVEMWDHG